MVNSLAIPVNLPAAQTKNVGPIIDPPKKYDSPAKTTANPVLLNLTPTISTGEVETKKEVAPLPTVLEPVPTPAKNPQIKAKSEEPIIDPPKRQNDKETLDTPKIKEIYVESDPTLIPTNEPIEEPKITTTQYLAEPTVDPELHPIDLLLYRTDELESPIEPLFESPVVELEKNVENEEEVASAPTVPEPVAAPTTDIDIITKVEDPMIDSPKEQNDEEPADMVEIEPIYVESDPVLTPTNDPMEEPSTTTTQYQIEPTDDPELHPIDPLLYPTEEPESKVYEIDYEESPIEPVFDSGVESPVIEE
ncbi:cell surface glycoprotein 1-like, partial [Sitodiplosis mosellana]|uniref:cell surface glycoprotein 1-like n=1 Tax=Sitodiplosis mosellana TaxID=263140 RepID=UPI00244451D6